MEAHRDKYVEYMLRTRGFCEKYSKRSSRYIDKLVDFLRKKGIKDFRKVTRDILDQFQKEAMSSKKHAASSKQSLLITINLFFRFLFNYEYIEDDVGMVIDVPRRPNAIPRNIMSQKEITYLLSIVDKKDLMGMRDFCIMSLLYSSAMRIGEICKLKVDDFDHKHKQVYVRRPKNKRDRIVHIDGYTAHYLNKYIKDIRPWLLRKDKDMDNLFISHWGDSLKVSSFASYFKDKYDPPMYKKFKKHVTPYSFRHTSATHWLDEGAKKKRDLLPYVQRQLGHESLESTAIYTRVAIEPLRQMFKHYHPREFTLKPLHAIPSPKDIISPLEKDNK
ncbi:MAG: tyrosine-type recombinase/integrase [Candidatus Omnitrophica bacterium]|nr:tyrosine-type recombinase/integrase [Candidatus Omnitrophota bacterium]